MADNTGPVAVPQRQFDRFKEPRPQTFFDHDTVDDHLDVVRPRFFQLGWR